MKKIIKKILLNTGYKISKITIVKRDEILRNVFSSNFEKKVLISYLTEPFISGINQKHTNLTECLTAAEAFHDLGYSVDVINFDDDESEIDFSKYEVVYGQWIPFEKAFLAKGTNKIKKILYGTGTNPLYFQKVSGKCIYDFYIKTGLMLPESGRITNIAAPLQHMCSDAVIVLGNEFCKETYTQINPLLNCYSLNLFYFDVYDIDLSSKDYSKAKKHFLWFGSSGLLYNGLGLCIDIFSQRDDIVLHICGGSKNENKFWDYYQPIISDSQNIINHGFVDIESDEFKQIMNTCAFALFPSVSEGGAAALLNIMANGGLIPIATKGCSLDINELGFIIDDANQKNVELAIEDALKLTDIELMEKSKVTKTTIRSIYTLDKYKGNLKNLIEKILKKN
jgi:hypothetical protein